VTTTLWGLTTLAPILILAGSLAAVLASCRVVRERPRSSKVTRSSSLFGDDGQPLVMLVLALLVGDGQKRRLLPD
jgi:hypothetical protein